MTDQDTSALVAEKALALRERLIATRRDFYMHPELSNEEARTAKVVAARLRDLGLEVEMDVGGYGVVGLLRGALPGATVAYRADMDALPVREALEVAYSSPVLGVKHACGHDVHMSVALGAAEILSELCAVLPGAVKFIFQPAEESLDGARRMIADGVLRSPEPAAIFAQHVFPIPLGQVGLAEGVCLAGMDEFQVRLYSPAGNFEQLAAQAASALRALSTAVVPSGAATFAALVRSMQLSDAHERTVLLSCWPHSEEFSTPDYHLLGLVSVPRLALREEIFARIRETLDRITDAMGATYDLTFSFHNPPVINAPELVEGVRAVSETLLGAQNVLLFKSPYPFAHEDFALFQQQVPGVLLWLGVANAEKGVTHLLHDARFDVDENALVIGTQLAVEVLLSFLGAHAKASL